MARSMRFAGWILLAGISFAFGRAAVVMAQEEAQASKSKHEVKEVMHGAHVAPEGGKSLRDKVLGGQATPEEKAQLLDFYVSLAQNEPPKGEQEAWNKKTRDVVVAAAMIVVGREDGPDALRKATICASCHKDHKPPQ